jgi:hypothetical protein
MAKSSKVPRTDYDLLEALLRHVELLREYSQKAFEQGKGDYLGEVAGKLRVLVVETRMNKPLLLALMKKFGSRTQVLLDDPYEQDHISLDQFMERLCVAIRTDSGMKSFTNREFVATWAQQHGAAHEDWEHDEGFAAVRASGIFIGGDPAHSRCLRAIARTVLSVSEAFFNELGERGILVPITEDG